MIKGVHTLFYASDPKGVRAFLRDKLGLLFTDVGDGWLIFDLPDAEVGCHPLEKEGGQTVPAGKQEISFYCDDIHQTVADLKGRGVEFTDAVADLGWGLATHFRMPGDFVVLLYQPRYRRNSAGK